jgi:hypothetical protein
MLSQNLQLGIVCRCRLGVVWPIGLLLSGWVWGKAKDSQVWTEVRIGNRIGTNRNWNCRTKICFVKLRAFQRLLEFCICIFIHNDFEITDFSGFYDFGIGIKSGLFRPIYLKTLLLKQNCGIKFVKGLKTKETLCKNLPINVNGSSLLIVMLPINT